MKFRNKDGSLTEIDDIVWFKNNLVFNENLWYPKVYVHDMFPDVKFSSYSEMAAHCKNMGMPVTYVPMLDNKEGYSYHSEPGTPIPLAQHLKEVEERVNRTG